MPAKSGKQYRLMAGIMGGSIHGKGMPSKAVAREFVEKTPEKKRKKFAKSVKQHAKKD